MWEENYYRLSIEAARQQGMITSAQASKVGVEGRILDHFSSVGLLQVLDWDVYQLAGSPLGPRYAYPYAAWLATSPELFRWERPGTLTDDTVLSHESACALYGLGTVSAPLMMFTSPDERAAPRATTIHVARLAAGDAMLFMDIPVTTPHRTILDLCRDWTGHDEIRDVMIDAVRRDLVDLWTLHKDMATLAERHHFPSEGAEFVRYFLPAAPLACLSVRNVRAYAALAFPDKVAELQRCVPQLLADRNLGSLDEKLSWQIAAEIVGMIEWDM